MILFIQQCFLHKYSTYVCFENVFLPGLLLMMQNSLIFV